MQKSKEIRWFVKEPDPAVISWFAGKGMSFGNTASRTDFYLPLGQDDLNIKLREGNVEVKQRTDAPNPQKLTSHSTGNYENWVKWSFNLSDADGLSLAIIDTKKYDWLETVKTRMGVKLQNDENGGDELFSMSEQLDHGCQIEYTRVLVNHQTYFTFGLEWFGQLDTIIPKILLEDILGVTTYSLQESMSYAGFLKHLFYND